MFEGKHIPKVGEDDRINEKTSKRVGCKAMVCTNKKKGADQFSYTRILLNHSHKLSPDPKFTKRMHCHKCMDPATMEIMDVMQASHVPHANLMSVLKKVAGGSKNLRLTERDVQNRYVLKKICSTNHY